jgi:hypothetical protein
LYAYDVYSDSRSVEAVYVDIGAHMLYTLTVVAWKLYILTFPSIFVNLLRSWAPADSFVVEHIPDMDKKVTAFFGDGQKGERKSHYAYYKHCILRACMRHRAVDLGRDRRVQKIGCATYNSCVHSRTEEQVDEKLQMLHDFDQGNSGRGAQAHARVTALPKEVQFPASAIAAGHGPSYGRDTSNDAEVCWPMLKAVRGEPDMFKQFYRAAAVMQQQYNRSLQEVAVLKQRGEKAAT